MDRINNINIIAKYHQIAKCTEDGCICPSFKNPNGSDIKMLNGSILCLGCNHTIAKHNRFPIDFVNKLREQFKQREMQNQMNQMNQMNQNNQNNPNNQNHPINQNNQNVQNNNRITNTKNIYQGMDPSEFLGNNTSDDPVNDKPPFQTPVISMIVHNFFELTYGNGVLTEENRILFEKLILLFLAIINSPKFLLDIEKKIQPHKLPKTFQDNCLRWTNYCSSKAIEPPKQLAQVFGKDMMNSIFPIVKRILQNSNSLPKFNSKQWESDVKQIYERGIHTRFLLDLQKEIANSNTIIYSHNFQEKLKILRSTSNVPNLPGNNNNIVNNENIHGNPNSLVSPPFNSTPNPPIIQQPIKQINNTVPNKANFLYQQNIPNTGTSINSSFNNLISFTNTHTGGNGNSKMSSVPETSSSNTPPKPTHGMKRKYNPNNLKEEKPTMEGNVKKMGAPTLTQQNSGVVIKSEQDHAILSSNISNINNSITNFNSTFSNDFKKIKLHEPYSPYQIDGKDLQYYEQSQLTMCVIRNDNKPQSLVWLSQLKEVFSKQLPKMPKEYIFRLVFDTKHRSLLVLKNPTKEELVSYQQKIEKNRKTYGEDSYKYKFVPLPHKVLGGICVNPFVEQKFVEIVFLAISSSQQVKGYGTLVMNHLKEYCKREGLRFFLTYADNNAVGYFKKQGFSDNIKLSKKEWGGRIKDYDGGTLMECEVLPSVDYLSVSDVLNKQREYLIECIEKNSTSHFVFPPISIFKDSQVSGLKINIMDIKGVKESGWDPRQLVTDQDSFLSDDNVDSVSLQKELSEFLLAVKKHSYAWPFKEAVGEDVEGYYEIIKDPIDLATMGKKLENKEYSNRKMFVDDLRLMCENARVFNSSDTTYYKCANTIDQFVNNRVKQNFLLWKKNQL